MMGLNGVRLNLRMLLIHGCLYRSLAVGTQKGYRLFALNSVDRLEKIHQSAELEDVTLVERLFSSSLVAVVTLPSSRKLKVSVHRQRPPI